MALTVSVSDKTVQGNKLVRTGTIAFDSSYPTGGESLTAANVGLSKVEHIMIEPTSGYVFEYDYTNSKVLAYRADYDAVADGALIQVANATDLSGVTGVNFEAKGH